MASIKLLGLKRDVQAHQGNDIVIDMELYDSAGLHQNMAGYTLTAEFRSQRDTITCTLANSRLSWTNQGQGKWRLRIPAAVTAELVFSKGEDTLQMSYDMEVDSNTPSPGRFKPFYGTLTLTREQTRLA